MTAPDAVLALQREVGNQAVAGMLKSSPSAVLQRREPGPEAPQTIPDDPAAHPEWPDFRRALGEHLPEFEIEWVWRLMLQGIRAQAGGKRAAADASFWAAAEGLRSLLGVSPGRKMALWTGGFDVSRYAERKKFSTLEGTTAGRVLDSLELYKDWAIIGILWNHLSRVFVQGAQGEVHVFMRVHDPRSVLLTEEIPGLKALDEMTGITIRWHALFGQRLEEIREIDARGKLVEDASFADLDSVRRVLKDYVRDHGSGSRAAAEMKTD
jgi:hypothetical protein